MQLTISTTHQPATDLGYLLHKNPSAVHETTLGFGTARVFYPAASAMYTAAVVQVDIDPVALVRDRKGPLGNNFSLAQYVNDRPYVSSSFLSVALGKLFGTALSGRSKERPELTATPLDFTVELPVVSCVGGETILRRIFEPLG